MVVLPLPNRTNEPEVEPAAAQEKELNWAGYAAGVSLLAGGLLLLTGKRRAGMVAASAGTALALLDQQETLRTWWHTLPSYIDEVQRTLSQVQNAVNDMAAKRETLHRILSR
jgi:hypothetical protein